MRHALRSVLLTCAFLMACGGGDANEPEDPFPDAAGVYEISGGFDDLPTSIGSFEGTLELTQATRASGALQGSAAILATLDGDVFNLNDASLTSANVSPSGVITFTMGDNSTTWTFSGTLSGASIGQGRHTLSGGGESLSGNWQGTLSAGSAAAAGIAARSLSLEALRIRLMPAPYR
jgi:hypothetical protein